MGRDPIGAISGLLVVIGMMFAFLAIREGMPAAGPSLGSHPTDTSSPSTALRLPLRLNQGTGNCTLMEARGVLTGDPHDAWVAWLTASNGERENVLWPAGYTAQFNPQVELLDSYGRIVAAGGDLVRLGGSVASDIPGEPPVFGACLFGGVLATDAR